MMGDNRDNSQRRSRYWGFVPGRPHPSGRAFFIWMNWDDIAASRSAGRQRHSLRGSDGGTAIGVRKRGQSDRLPVLAAVVIIFAMVGFRVVPSYVEYFTVKKALDHTMRSGNENEPDAVRAPFAAVEKTIAATLDPSSLGKDLDIVKATTRSSSGFAYREGVVHMIGRLTSCSSTRAAKRWAATFRRRIMTDRSRAAATRPPLRRPAAARAALTHRSFGADHNERLEFVGDAVLNCASRCALRALRQIDRGRPLACAQPRQPRHARASRAQLGLGDAIAGEGEGARRRRRSPLDPRRRARRRCSARCSSTAASTPRARDRRLFGDVLATPTRRSARTPRPSCRNGCRRGAAGADYRIVVTDGEAHARPSRSSAASPRSAWRPGEGAAGAAARAARAAARREARGWIRPLEQPGGPRRGERSGASERRRASLRPRRDRRPAQRRQVDAAERAGRRRRSASPRARPQTTRHRITGVRTEPGAVRVRRHAGLPDAARSPLNRALNRAVRDALADVDVVVFVVEAAQLWPTPRCSALLPAARARAWRRQQDRCVHRQGGAAAPARGDRARHAQFAAIVPISAERGTQERLLKEGSPSSCPSRPGAVRRGRADRSRRALPRRRVRPREDLPPSATRCPTPRR